MGMSLGLVRGFTVLLDFIVYNSANLFYKTSWGLSLYSSCFQPWLHIGITWGTLKIPVSSPYSRILMSLGWDALQALGIWKAAQQSKCVATFESCCFTGNSVIPFAWGLWERKDGCLNKNKKQAKCSLLIKVFLCLVACLSSICAKAIVFAPATC